MTPQVRATERAVLAEGEWLSHQAIAENLGIFKADVTVWTQAVSSAQGSRCKGKRASVLAQSSNVPFVPFRNVPFWPTGGHDARGDHRVDAASATPAEGGRGGHGPAADASGGRVAVGTHDAAGEAPGGGLPGRGSRGPGLPALGAAFEPTAEGAVAGGDPRPAGGALPGLRANPGAGEAPGGTPD